MNCRLAVRRSLVVSLVLLALAFPLSIVAAGLTVLDFDIALTRAIQAWGGSGLDPVVRTVSWIGDGFPPMAALALLAVVALSAAGHRREAVLVGVAAAIRVLSSPLKALFESPRPETGLLRVSDHATGLGFPSGHALGAILFYGALVVIAPAVIPHRGVVLVARGAAVALAIAIGLSRIWLGAHWPSDVLGGYLWGGAILALLTAVYARCPRDVPEAAPEDAMPLGQRG